MLFYSCVMSVTHLIKVVV